MRARGRIVDLRKMGAAAELTEDKARQLNLDVTQAVNDLIALK